ncbi:MAG: TonB-dependent receptor [Spirochaetaceae bacterium]|nr:TonB-dependent receptor [Spirochaetaceae bacterium]
MHRRKNLVLLCLLCGFILNPLWCEEGEEDYSYDDFPVMEGEGLTVVSTPETTQQIKTITKEDIEKTHAMDVAAALEQLLDMPVTRYGGYGNTASVNMRGFGSGRVAILVDGVPVNSPQSGAFELSMLDINSIERIEIIYGGSDSKFNVSGALGGVINIITVKKQKPGWRLGGGVSTTSYMPGKYYALPGGEKKDPALQDLVDTQNVTAFAGYGGEGFSLSANIFANRAQNHFTFEDTYGTTRRRENNEIWDAGASASLVFDLPDAAKLIAGGDIYYGDKNIAGTMYNRNTGKQEDFSSRQSLMLNLPRVFSDDFSTEAALSHTGQTLSYKDSRSDSLHKLHTFTAINRWTWYAFDGLSLKAGGDYRYSRLDSTNTGIRGIHDGGGYVTMEASPHEKLLFVPSVKIVSNGTVTRPIPKFGIVFYAADFLTLKNNYFRMFKFPTLNDLYWSLGTIERGNPDLKPEDGWGADLIAETRWAGVFNFETSFYAQRIRDSIHWRSSGGLLTPINVGKADYFGWDARVKSDFSDWFILSASYQYLITYILTGDFTYSSNIRMPYIPMHTAGVSVEFRWTGGSLLVSGHYEGLRYETYNLVANAHELDPHLLVSITLNQKLGENISFFAALRNLLNQSYVSMMDYPMPGINLTMGIKAVFE